jgi:hypothetical protein
MAGSSSLDLSRRIADSHHLVAERRLRSIFSSHPSPFPLPHPRLSLAATMELLVAALIRFAARVDGKGGGSVSISINMH